MLCSIYLDAFKVTFVTWFILSEFNLFHQTIEWEMLYNPNAFELHYNLGEAMLNAPQKKISKV